MNKSSKIIQQALQDLAGIALPTDMHQAAGFHLLPNRREIVRIIRDLQTTLFPRYFPNPRVDRPEDLLSQIHRRLMEQAALALPFSEPFDCDASCIGERLIQKLPSIKQTLLTDIEGIYQGDPAATSFDEVVICYPGFYATMIYRLAHELYLLKLPLIPRIMTEYAHEKTGIDIHAGASIGEHFCIDHGTGVVIGETARLGHHVKLYQGVTIGAKSFELDEAGYPVKGIKRHPDIGNHVVIYANATILGGDTTIGDNSVIGGNVWLTHSVPKNSVLYYDATQIQKDITAQ
ncbi:MAG: serine acetyltransferase [Clostridiales bacterium]|nr:serine acetyltransferase [Clostridiales bacterium]